MMHEVNSALEFMHAVNGVSFRLSFIPLRLRGYAYRCTFCGYNTRTTTAEGRAESMQRHAAKADHRSAA